MGGGPGATVPCSSARRTLSPTPAPPHLDRRLCVQPQVVDAAVGAGLLQNEAVGVGIVGKHGARHLLPRARGGDASVRERWQQGWGSPPAPCSAGSRCRAWRWRREAAAAAHGAAQRRGRAAAQRSPARRAAAPRCAAAPRDAGPSHPAVGRTSSNTVSIVTLAPISQPPMGAVGGGSPAEPMGPAGGPPPGSAAGPAVRLADCRGPTYMGGLKRAWRVGDLKARAPREGLIGGAC
jgi:hypothetical protein